MEIILIGFIISLAISAGALTFSLVKAERRDVTTNGVGDWKNLMLN